MTAVVNFRLALACALAASFAPACTSTAARYYTLTARTSVAPISTDQLNVEVSHTTIPALVDRMQLVSYESATRIRINETARWAVSLRDQVSSVLVEDLRNDLPAAIVSDRPLPPGAHATIVVRIDIEQLEAVENEYTRIRARWVLSEANTRRACTAEATASQHLRGASPEAMVLAWSASLSEIGSATARSVQEFQSRLALSPVQGMDGMTRASHDGPQRPCSNEDVANE